MGRECNIYNRSISGVKSVSESEITSIKVDPIEIKDGSSKDPKVSNSSMTKLRGNRVGTSFESRGVKTGFNWSG